MRFLGPPSTPTGRAALPVSARVTQPNGTDRSLILATQLTLLHEFQGLGETRCFQAVNEGRERHPAERVGNLLRPGN